MPMSPTGFRYMMAMSFRVLDAKNSAQERRRIEEAFVAGLQKLANRPLSQSNLELG
jgi:hypothetical protein